MEGSPVVQGGGAEPWLRRRGPWRRGDDEGVSGRPHRRKAAPAARCKAVARRLGSVWVRRSCLRRGGIGRLGLVKQLFRGVAANGGGDGGGLARRCGSWRDDDTVTRRTATSRQRLGANSELHGSNAALPLCRGARRRGRRWRGRGQPRGWRAATEAWRAQEGGRLWRRGREMTRKGPRPGFYNWTARAPRGTQTDGRR